MIPTVHKRRTFTELRQHGRRVQHGTVRMTYLASPTTANGRWDGPRVAYAFSRRFGKAVQRNRARRRLRDAFARAWNEHADENPDMNSLNGAFLLSGTRRILTAPFDGVVADTTVCLQKLSVT